MKKILIENNPEIASSSKQEIIDSNVILSGKDCIKLKMSSSLHHKKSLIGHLHVMSHGYIFLTDGSKSFLGLSTDVSRAIVGNTFGIVGMLVADSIVEKSKKKLPINDLINNPYSEFVSYLNINSIQYSMFGSTCIISHEAEDGTKTITSTYHEVNPIKMVELIVFSRFNLERDTYTNYFNNNGGELTFGVDLEEYLQSKLQHLLSIDVLLDFLRRL